MSKGKYRMLFSPNRRRQHGPKGPSAELFHAAASASMPAPSMVSHSVGCLTAPFEANAGCRSTSAPTTIPFIVPPVASQSANTRVITNQVHPLRSPVHPFVERLIGTIRREYLDHLLFWTTADLEGKLLDFRTYFNNYRTHTSREGRTPDTPVSRTIANLRSFRWQTHCRSLYQTPMAP